MFVAYGLGLADLILHIIKDLKRLDASLPCSEPMRASSSAIACLTIVLMPELRFKSGNDLLLMVLPQLVEVIDSFWGEGYGKYYSLGHGWPRPLWE